MAFTDKVDKKPHALKTKTVEEIEAAIATALTKLVGVEQECKIDKITYVSYSSKADIILSLKTIHQ